MGILNNIWMAVSTPNESLINIFLVIGIFIENYLIMTLYISLLYNTYKIRQKIIYVCLSSLCSIITLFIVPTPFNVFINYFLTITLQFILFKNPFLKSILSSVTSLVIFNLIGILILNPFITILHITTDQLNITPIYRLSYLLVIYAITILSILVLKNRKLKLDSFEEIDKKNKYIIIANLFFGILALILQSVTLFYYVDTLPNIITFLSFISLLAYFAISIYSSTRVFKLILTTRKLESAEAYNNTLRILHDNVRGFKHDFDNIVTTIGGYIKTNDMEGLKNYYSQLEDDCQRVNNLYILNPDIVNNDGIYNLLTKKYYEAEREDIKVNITFLLDLSTLHMKIYEFARILGILLDNAIEASSESTEKIINLSFRDDFRNSRQLITIENTYSNKDVNTDIIFEKGVSGKDDHTGLGLWEVRKLIKKNNNINLFTTKDDKFFKQQLEIYY